jgi:hypothetical protein
MGSSGSGKTTDTSSPPEFLSGPVDRSADRRLAAARNEARRLLSVKKLDESALTYSLLAFADRAQCGEWLPEFERRIPRMLEYETNPVMKDMADAFARAEKITDFPPDAGLAIWACESAWGALLTGDYNYWGITRYPEAGPAKFCPTHEDVTPLELAAFRADERTTAVFIKALGGGRNRYSMKRWFASYAGIDQSIMAFIEFFTRSPKRYAAAWEAYQSDRGSPEASTTLLKSICESGYATGDAENTELSIEHQSNIVHAVEMARAAAVPAGVTA